MSIDINSNTQEVSNSEFTPTNHLLGIVQGVLASRENTRVFLAGKGEMVIYPELGRYYDDVQSMDEFCRAPAGQFVVTAIDAASPLYVTGEGKKITDLLWQAAFFGSSGKLLANCSKFNVVQFLRWPNLTRLPVTPNAGRICALLTRHPTTLRLVHRMLDISTEEVYQIYNAAYCSGITQTISFQMGGAHVEQEDAEPNSVPEKGRGLFRSLFSKIAGL